MPIIDVAADRLAAARHHDLGIEFFDALHEFCRRARVQPFAIDDWHVTDDRAVRKLRFGVIVLAEDRRSFPVEHPARNVDVFAAGILRLRDGLRSSRSRAPRRA